MKKTVPLASLVEDFSFYPRHDVDSSHVADLIRAVESGLILPPPIVDEKSLRIVDGFHRIRAYVRVLGAGGEVEVELRRYKTEADMLREAIDLNSAHGRKLDQQDRARCAVLMEQQGFPVEEVAVALHTSPDRVRQLLIRVVLVAGRKEPVKPILWTRDKIPKKLTKEQFGIAKSSSGWRPLQTVTQLTREIEVGLIDFGDEKLVAALWGLHAAIGNRTPKASAA